MRSEFENVVRKVRDGIASGELKISEPLSDFDLAVMFAASKIGQQRGYPCDITVDEIYRLIMDFAPELMEEPQINGRQSKEQKP